MWIIQWKKIYYKYRLIKKSGVEKQDTSNFLDMLVHQSMIKVEKNGVIKVHN